MAWKSREGKRPPAQFYAEVIAYLMRSYPRATISKEVMDALKPFLDEAWRDGATAREAAQATCMCKGAEIVPSPATRVRIAKGSVRPPKGIERGEVFGADELREPGQVVKLRAEIRKYEERAQRKQVFADEAAARERAARADTIRMAAISRRQSAEAERDDALAKAKGLTEELNALLRDHKLGAAQRTRKAVEAVLKPRKKAEKPAAAPAVNAAPQTAESAPPSPPAATPVPPASAPAAASPSVPAASPAKPDLAEIGLAIEQAAAGIDELEL